MHGYVLIKLCLYGLKVTWGARAGFGINSAMRPSLRLMTIRCTGWRSYGSMSAGRNWFVTWRAGFGINSAMRPSLRLMTIRCTGWRSYGSMSAGRNWCDIGVLAVAEGGYAGLRSFFFFWIELNWIEFYLQDMKSSTEQQNNNRQIIINTRNTT